MKIRHNAIFPLLNITKGVHPSGTKTLMENHNPPVQVNQINKVNVKERYLQRNGYLPKK